MFRDYNWRGIWPKWRSQTSPNSCLELISFKFQKLHKNGCSSEIFSHHGNQSDSSPDNCPVLWPVCTCGTQWSLSSSCASKGSLPRRGSGDTRHLGGWPWWHPAGRQGPCVSAGDQQPQAVLKAGCGDDSNEHFCLRSSRSSHCALCVS